MLVALVPILAFGVLASVVTVPFVALGPGPTFNTLGEIDGKPVVDIEGTDVYPTSGHLNMTTVSQRDQLTLGQAMALWLSGRDQLVPRDLVYPPDKSKEEVEEANTTDFRRSEDSAEYAALQYLDYPMAVTVENVNEDGPSAGKLQAGDAIDFVNGKPVANLEEFQEQLKDTKPGDTVVLDYRRKDGPPGTATITLGKHPERDQGFLGIGVLDAPWAPFSIKFNLANVGGPSAGLMFSLAVIDKLTTGDLNDGQFVAGTGTISGDGKVGSIGGITHKMLAAREAGASLFLVPAENCEEAKSAPQDGLELVRVETLEQAVDALKTLSAGGERPHC
ncbi:PDZ domain-containing protein [Mycolicibacterium phlei]|nr:Lon protease 2 [Mycolicibacterium phlei]KXW61863.1 signal protein PDZ [Mycolicibacterium phlei DSM 43072]KXW73287.1 signal protein PDZ [Mycolicibacterium phlei DSM 43070]STZ17102.1 PDZ domain-containing protein [Mycolicibacterium phlei]VEG08653.1 PDZ domain-containing protein [Mycobacteroides chelonae]